MAVSKYDREHLTKEQQDRIQAATDYGNRTGDWAKAHADAEAVRKQAAGGGYSGGRYGNEHISSGLKHNYGGAYNPGKHDSIIDEMDRLASQGKWDEAGAMSGQLITGPQSQYQSGDGTLMNQVMNELTKKYKYNANDYYRGKYDSIYGKGTWDDPNHWPGQQVPIGNIPNIPGVMGQAPTYGGSKWDDYLNELGDKLAHMNYEDWTNGQQYQDLADRYGDMGEQAMQQTLGQMAARTGGLASSYATTAASQANNDYMKQLEEAARKMYGAERGEMLDDAQFAHGMAQDDYNRYLDQLGQWNADRQFNYGVSRDQIEDKRYQDQWDRDQNRWQAEWDRDESRYGDQMSLDKADKMAQYGDFSGYKALGYSDAEIAAMSKGYRDEIARSTAKRSSGGGRSSGGSRKSSKPQYDYSNQDYDGLFSAAMDSGHPQNYIANHHDEFGIKNTSGLMDDYKKWAKNNANSGGEGDNESTAKYEPFSMSTFRHLLHTDQQAAMEYANMHMDNMSDEDYKEVSHFLS